MSGLPPYYLSDIHSYAIEVMGRGQKDSDEIQDKACLFLPLDEDYCLVLLVGVMEDATGYGYGNPCIAREKPILELVNGGSVRCRLFQSSGAESTPSGPMASQERTAVYEDGKSRSFAEPRTAPSWNFS